MNELNQETSPYLLQHAQNPVHWKAWKPKILQKAKTENKLILISIGYSACHWCHVMEHESFEDSEVAEIMNRHFINIKVDREERPDIDSVYMKAVQIMTGRGGWPLNVVCLPDGKPVWGGTYFRKNQWTNTLEQLAELFENQPEKMFEYAEKLSEGMQAISVIQSDAGDFAYNEEIIKDLVQQWQTTFDYEFGGQNYAPKFMMPTNYQFLLRYAVHTNDSKLLDYINLTLTRMAWGGIFDTVDGGFSRYSTDMKWHVPHFEKMLYDNGQLVSLYAEAFKLTKNPLYKELIEKTLRFVEREWLTDFNGFYAALDADSLDENGHLEEGEFYVWKEDELQKLLGSEFELFKEVFSINDFGHWENGRYVLICQTSLYSLSEKLGIEKETLTILKQKWEKILFETREKRPKPRLDDKCLTSWNALMLKGFTDAYDALGNKDYLQTALDNANFIINRIWQPEGNLMHSYKNGKAAQNGFLEDYALVIHSFLGLYKTTLDEKWLHHSKNLTDYCLDHFYDENKQFFRFTSDLDDKLVTEHFELEDNVIPASNSVMAKNLLRLNIYFENQRYRIIAENMLKNIVPNINYPPAFSNWLDCYLDFSPENRELAICGSDADNAVAKLNAVYLPYIVLGGSTTNSNLPFLKNRFQDNETLYYICRNQSCQKPETDFSQVLRNLNISAR